MTLKTLSLTVSLSCLLLSGCGSTGAPSCSDEAVKQLVLEIADRETRQNFFERGVSMRGIVLANRSYEAWRNNPPGDNASVLAVVEEVDQQVTALNYRLTGVRTDGVNDQIRKVECGGTLTFLENNTSDIAFTAQYTDDNQLWVEVFGL